MNFVAVFEGQGTLTAFRTTQATQLVMDACRILRLENVLSFFFFFFFFPFFVAKKTQHPHRAASASRRRMNRDAKSVMHSLDVCLLSTTDLCVLECFLGCTALLHHC